MNSPMTLVSRFQRANPRKTLLAIFSVVLSAALVTTIFSMFDLLQRTEKIQVVKETGNYHLMVQEAAEQEMAAIRSRVDVKNAGEWISFEPAAINGMECRLAAIEEGYAANLHVEVVEGRFPSGPDELMLESWALEALRPAVKTGERVKMRLGDGQEREYTLTGVFSDFSGTKAAARPGVLLSMAAARQVEARKTSLFLIEFKEGVNIPKARRSIQTSLGIPDERMAQNEKLLVVMGQSQHEAALGLYATAAGLFFIVLIAGVVMIYNTFNISVMERVRQFGLLRCIGASKAQIRRIVWGEGLRITLRAVPLGVLAGTLITFACAAFLKFYNRSMFGEMPLFAISAPGLAAGAAVGFLTVLTASFAPVRKAAAVSPVSAVTGSADNLPSKKRKSGFLTRLLPVEVALGIDNAVARKRTLLLMSASLALSIILFLGFNVFIQFMHTAMKTTKPYTPDISIASEEGLSNELYAKIGALSGVEKAYGRMFGYVNASFDASLLDPSYLELVGEVQELEDGRFVPREASWLISYDDDQLRWARQDLVEGTLDEEALNAGEGIVAVLSNVRKGISSQPVNWRLGDRVTIETDKGLREMTVMAILRAVPFSDNRLNMTTLITTEKLFSELTGDSTLDVIDVQLEEGGQEQTIHEIRALLGKGMSLHDQRQKNEEVDQIFTSVAVLVYGFVVVIALISVLNVMNTIQTSVAVKTRYLGVMRAVGMTGRQLNRMVLAEVGTYNLLGCLAGIGLGIPLQRYLATGALGFAHIRWEMPWAQLALIVALDALISGLSAIQPLRQIKSRGITEVIGAL